MNKIRRVNLKKFLSLIILFVFALIPSVAKADTPHQLSFKMVKCDPSKYNNFATLEDYENLQADYLDGLLDSYVVGPDDEVDPGTTVMFVLNYLPGSPANAISLQSRMFFDTQVLEPVMDDDIGDVFFINGETSQFPSRTNYTGDWHYDSTEGYISGSFEDAAKRRKPIEGEAEIAYFFMKVNSAASGTIGMEFSKIGGQVFASDADGGSIVLKGTDATLSIAGGEVVSHDATLGSLSVKNGQTEYVLKPTFTAGSTTNTTYSTTVSAYTTSINLNATAYHKGATVLPAGLGSKDLNVGQNTFKITVQSEFGNTEVYTINVYRLSDDATLKSITLTNGINLGAITAGKFAYSATVPFATTNTNISAETTHPNATIENGLGNWNLNNYGTNTNNKIITVKAENCRPEYANVPGVNCVSKSYDVTINRIAPSSNNYLKTLTVNGVQVSGFNKETLEYNVGNVLNSRTSITIGGEVEDTGKATITGTGNVNLNIGENIFTVTVTAEDGTPKAYKIRVYRVSNETKLSSLTVTSTPQATLTPSFSETFDGEYTYNYDATVKQIDISATVKDKDKARIVIYDASITDTSTLVSELNTQTKTFTNDIPSKVGVMVTAEDGTVDTHIINLTRSKSVDPTLRELSIDRGTLEQKFESSKRNYTATVDPDVTSVNVTALTTSEYARVTEIRGNNNLQFGNNTIEIDVLAEDERTTATYSIVVTRLKYNISTLEDIKINGNSISGFQPTTFKYTLDPVSFETTSLNITTVKTNNYSNVSGDGTVTLTTGVNTITITVTAQNGIDKSEYILTVERAKNSNNKIGDLYVKGIPATVVDDSTYEVTVANNVTEINPSDVVFTAPSDATVSKTMVLPLVTEYPNIYKFTVTSESGDAKIYTVKITRTKSNDASISRVTLGIGADNSRYCLMDETNTCKIEVPVNTTEFTLSAEINEKSTISPVNGTRYEMTAAESLKPVTLTVTAEDDTVVVYTVNVERQKSSITNLSDLKVDGKTVKDFDASKLTYELTVDGDTDSVMVDATVQDTGKARILTDLSQPFPLEFDSRNPIEVTVKSEAGQEKTYTIYITRNHRTDTSLADLTINGTRIEGFESTKDQYTLDPLPYNTHQLNIIATPTDSNATKSGDGLVRINTGANNITITVTAHDTSVTKDYVIHVHREQSDYTNIKGMSLAGVPAVYNNNTKKYEVTVPNNITEANRDNLIVEVADPITPEDKKAEYTFNTTELSTEDPTEIVISVIAENGTLKPYTLSVTRTKSNVATLDSLTVTDGSFNPSFSPGVFEYTVTVPVDTIEFDVAATKTDAKSEITGGTGHYTLSASTATVNVVVVSEDLKKTNTYKLNIVRTESSVNTLKSITVSEGELSPEFNPDKRSYTVNVDGDVESIDIQAELTDDRATLVSGIGILKLNVGNNQTIIHVRSESGASAYYTVNVIRAPKANNSLSDLTVDGETVKNFNEELLEYTLDNVPYTTTSIDIGATAKDPDATIKGTGKKGLKTGLNTFEIVVTAQNGTEKTYKINITREKNDNAFLRILSVKGYTLTPNFDGENEFDYEITVDSTKETISPSEITAVPQDPNATVEKGEELTLSTETDNYYEVVVKAENERTTSTYTIKVIRPRSSDATLSNVEVKGASISPEFAPNKFEYVLTVPYGKRDFSIKGIPNYGKTKVFGDGDYTLDDGIVQLTTQAEDGTTEVYKFTIIEAQSNDATLASLSVQSYPFGKTFQPTELIYSIGEIPYGTTQLKINAVATNANAEIEYYVDGIKQDSNIVTIPQVMAAKTIVVKVIAADGVAEKPYNINYTLVSSKNVFLSSIVPSVGEIDFLKTTKYYELSVANDVESIDLTITTEDSNASISVNGGEASFTPKTITIPNLTVGDNPVSILVTAQDGTTKDTYDVVIKRLQPVASDDAYLSNLSVEGYPFNKEFDMEDLEYSIGKIPFGVTELTINATQNTGSSTVSYMVNGVKQSSNVVTIPTIDGQGAINVQVVAEDRTTIKNYKIKYSKQASDNAYLSNIIVSEGQLTFNKETYAYTVEVGSDVESIDITTILEDPTATMKINQETQTSPHTLTLSPLASGSTEVVIVTTAENGIVLTYKVTIKKETDILTTITSEEYGHTIVDGYIKTVRLSTTGIQMKDQLDNENEYLEIWTADESKLVSDSEIMKTGMIVKLMIGGVEKDRKIIVIRGDTSGDGLVNLFDAVKILNHHLGKQGQMLSGAYLQAGDVSLDNNVNLFDAVKILNHHLGKPGQLLY